MPTPQQLKKLRDALIDAFRDKSSLEQMLFFELNKSLDAIAGGSSLQEIVFKLIQTADSQGWVEDLIRSACKSNPRNSLLKAISQELLTTETSSNTFVSIEDFLTTQEYSVANEYKKNIRDFKKFVPPTYLNNLPRIKYKSYIDAHELWDTGITSRMHDGNKLLANKLYEILIDITETAYTSDFFEGKTVSQYYNDLILKFMKAAYDAQPNLQGTMYRLIAHSQRAQIIDDFIVKIVKDITDNSDFLQWKAKWDMAKELGTKGIGIDFFTEL